MTPLDAVMFALFLGTLCVAAAVIEEGIKEWKRRRQK